MPYFGSSPRNTNTRSVIDHQSYLGSQADTSTNSGYYTFYCNYTIGNVSVVLRGVHLADSDYTATNGTDIRIATSSITLNNDDVIEIIGHTVPSSQILERSDVNITGGIVSNTVLNNTNTYNFLDNSISGDKIDGGTISDSVLKLKSSGNSIVASDGTTGILSESSGTVTLTADEANIGSNALVVNSSGNVGIGTSSPNGKLAVSDGTVVGEINPYSAASGCYIGTRTNHSILFQVNASEKMRIDTSGNVLVNASSFQGGSTVGIQLNATNNASNAYAMLIKNSDGSEIFQFKCNGSASSSTGTWGSTSDINLKENIIDATNKLSDVLKLKVKNFNFKSDPEKTKYIGFIAQELETIFPNLVEEGVDGIKSVKTSILIPILTKAIQEQQALIESQQSQIDALTARIEALEAGN